MSRLLVTKLPLSHSSFARIRNPAARSTCQTLLHANTIATQSTAARLSSPFDPNTKKPTTSRPTAQKKRTFVPRKAAVKLTEKARKFFKLLLENPPRKDVIGVVLNYQQPKSGEPRMVFSFDFVTANDIDPNHDEGVSLEVIEEVDANGNKITVPKPPRDSQNDGLPKLFVHQNAFLKVLGATVDVDTETVTPVLYDREGNHMDPNA